MAKKSSAFKTVSVQVDERYLRAIKTACLKAHVSYKEFCSEAIKRTVEQELGAFLEANDALEKLEV